MKNKLFKFALYTHRLGLISALRILFKMFTGRKGAVISLKLPHILHPVYIRNQVYDQTTFQQIFINQEYNFEFRQQPINILDAGANIGLAAVYFANRFPAAKIICLEPEPENFEILKKNIASYQNIKAVQSGLWGKTSSLRIRDNGLGNWGFSVEECEAGEPGAISAVSLPDLMKEHQVSGFDIIKMDIEGSEKEVLEAEDHKEWLSNCRILIIELHDRMKKGTSSALFKALLPYEVEIEQMGENILCRFNPASAFQEDFSQTVTKPPVNL